MKTVLKVMLWLTAGTTVIMTALLVSARTETRWPYRKGHIKVLPVAQWPRRGGGTRFTLQRDGTYKVRRTKYHTVFCVSLPIEGAEAERLMAENQVGRPRPDV